MHSVTKGSWGSIRWMPTAARPAHHRYPSFPAEGFETRLSMKRQGRSMWLLLKCPHNPKKPRDCECRFHVGRLHPFIQSTRTGERTGSISKDKDEFVELAKKIASEIGGYIP